MPSMARGLTRVGRHDRGEAGAAGLVHRHVDQRELEVGADAGQVVEAGPGHLGAAVDVDRAEDPAELDVVAGLEALGGEVTRLADLLEHHVVVLAAGRCLVGGRVRDRHQRARGRPRRPRPGRPRPSSPRAESGLGALEQLPASPRPWRRGICLPSAFCSPRSRSNSTIAARRRSSAASASSTTSADSPRLVCAARSRSGSSRSMRGSITASAYPPDAGINRFRHCPVRAATSRRMPRSPRACILSGRRRGHCLARQ